MEEDSAETQQTSSSKKPSLEQLYAAVVCHDTTVLRHEQRLQTHESAFGRHEQLLHEIHQTLTTLVNRPSLSPPPSVPPASPAPAQPAYEPRLPTPERFDGDPRDCRGFLTQCSLTFELQSSTFPTDRARIAYVITLLTGKARAWATAIWEQQGPSCSSYQNFTDEMRRVFDHPVGGREAANRLFQLRQGNSSVAEYAVHFRTLAAESKWNMEALIATFHHGLSNYIRDELATKDPATTLESLIDQTIRLDNRMRERRCERQPELQSIHGASAPAPGPLQWSQEIRNLSSCSEEPMQLGGTRLSQTERSRRIRERCCLYCGKPGHFRSSCPELSGKVQFRPGGGVL